MSILKTVAKTLLIIIAVLVIVVGGYVAYVAIQYYRIEDNYALSIANGSAVSDKVTIGESYKISTYNIGFCAYAQDFSFFMDSGEFLDGKQVTGVNSKAKDIDTVKTNLTGAVSAIKQLDADFMFFQEVDVNGDRSHHVNQLQYIQENFLNNACVYAENFHTAYLFYPFNDPHGKTNAGIVTVSNKQAESAVRRSFPVDESFPNKFFDLDRCFSITYLPIEGSDKFLCLINVHTSAYDEGGLIRQQQMAMLNQVMTAERERGNYVIAGGDFNHDIANSDGLFPTAMKRPEWVFSLTDDDLAEGFRFAAATNVATCRSTDIPYQKGVNYTVVLDGFIVSDNVQVIANENIDLDFKYSDHNPATMTFKLK